MNAVIIVAGGKGLRMGTEVPKQFLPVGGKPVLMRTIQAFYDTDSSMEIVLVLPADQHDYWFSLCDKYAFSVPCKVAEGGESRFHSVKNGLAKVGAECVLVGVHDGVRPFVSRQTIENCYRQAEVYGAVVPVVKVVETVRCLESGGKTSVTVNRDNYRLVQTPQVFKASLLRKAYEQEFSPLFTDDASVVEALGHPVELVEGNRENIKITTPFDLVVAEAIIGSSPVDAG